MSKLDLTSDRPLSSSEARKLKADWERRGWSVDSEFSRRRGNKNFLHVRASKINKDDDKGTSVNTYESDGFRKWLTIQEGGLGSGTQFSLTGAGAGGQAQAGMGMKKPASPQKAPPSPFSPSDAVPKGFKPSPGAGGSVGIWKPSLPGLSGAGVIPKRSAPNRVTGGSLGGGYPGGKAMMKKKMRK